MYFFLVADDASKQAYVHLHIATTDTRSGAVVVYKIDDSISECSEYDLVMSQTDCKVSLQNI